MVSGESPPMSSPAGDRSRASVAVIELTTVLSMFFKDLVGSRSWAERTDVKRPGTESGQKHCLIAIVIVVHQDNGGHLIGGNFDGGVAVEQHRLFGIRKTIASGERRAMIANLYLPTEVVRQICERYRIRSSTEYHQ